MRLKRILCMVLSCMFFFGTLCLACAASPVDLNDEELLNEILDNSYAVITDEEGNILEYLDVDVALTQVGNSRSTSTTYQLTYTASETKTDSDAVGPVGGVTTTGTITWTDIAGPTNVLVSVSGSWSTFDETISGRSVSYGAKDSDGTSIASFQKHPYKDSFVYEPGNCTGYLFYMSTSATVDGTNRTISLYVETSAFS